MGFIKLLLGNTLAAGHYNYEAASESHLPKGASCIPVLSSCYIEKCTAFILMLSVLTHDCKDAHVYLAAKWLH